MKKKCCTCRRNKNTSLFGIDNTSIDGYYKRCLICSRKAASKWYYSNKTTACKRVIANQKRIRLWFNELKSKLKCISCGENHPACLDFHHRDPNQKRMAITHIVRLCSKKNILKEIEKCDVLCANCHRKFHASVV